MLKRLARWIKSHVAERKFRKGMDKTMYHDPGDKEKIAAIFRAYIQEWGTENVIVSVPKDWEVQVGKFDSSMRVEYTTAFRISIRAEAELKPGMIIQAMRYDYDLVPA